MEEISRLFFEALQPNNLLPSLANMAIPTVAETPGPTKEDGNSEQKEPSKVLKSRLERLLEMTEKSSRYIAEDEADAAYGIVKAQLAMGETGTFIPVLVNHYVALVKTGRFDKALQIQQEVSAQVKCTFKSSPKECEILADKYRENGRSFQAILFYQIAAELVSWISGDLQVNINCMQGCILGMKRSSMDILKNRPNFKKYMLQWGIPSMQDMTKKMMEAHAPGKTMMTLTEVLALHHIETCQRLAGDLSGRMESLQRAVRLMEGNLGEEAKKYELYGSTLNNLGSAYLMISDPASAINVYKKAIEAKSMAEDCKSQKVKNDDVAMSKRALKDAEEMMKYIDIY